MLGADTFHIRRHFMPTLVRAAICAGETISDGFAGSLGLFGIGDRVGTPLQNALCDMMELWLWMSVSQLERADPRTIAPVYLED